MSDEPVHEITEPRRSEARARARVKLEFLQHLFTYAVVICGLAAINPLDGQLQTEPRELDIRGALALQHGREPPRREFFGGERDDTGKRVRILESRRSAERQPSLPFVDDADAGQRNVARILGQGMRRGLARIIDGRRLQPADAKSAKRVDPPTADQLLRGLGASAEYACDDLVAFPDEMLTAERSRSGQRSGGPSSVLDQSSARMRAASSLLPGKMRSSEVMTRYP